MPYPGVTGFVSDGSLTDRRHGGLEVWLRGRGAEQQVNELLKNMVSNGFGRTDGSSELMGFLAGDIPRCDTSVKQSWGGAK